MTLKDNKLKLKSKDISNAQRDKHQAHSKPRQTPKMELFVKMVTNFQPLIIFAKYPILDVWQGFK